MFALLSEKQIKYLGSVMIRIMRGRRYIKGKREKQRKETGRTRKNEEERRKNEKERGRTRKN